MVESLLIYGVTTLASTGARRLLGLEKDGVPSRLVEHAFGEAVAEGAKRLRQQFTALKPERNHDLMEALQRAYLQTQLHLVLPWAERQGVEPRTVLKAAKVPDWAMHAWENLAGKPLGLGAAAAQENARKLVDRVLQGLRAPEPLEVPPGQLTAAFDHIDQVLGAKTWDTDVAALLTRSLEQDIALGWSGPLPEELAERIRENAFPYFQSCLFFFLKSKPEVKAVVDAALGVTILDEVRAGFAEVLKRLPAVAPAPALALVNVPDLTRPIVGRDDQAKFLLEYLETHRIAAIVAPPMFGKSAVVRRLLREVTDGVRIKREGLAGIVYLDGPLTLGRVFRETGRLTGQSEDWSQRADSPGGVADKLRDYWSYLQAFGPVWLILDSFEENLRGPQDPTVAEAVEPWLASFLKRQSPHRLILASRVAPRAKGVHPLAEIRNALDSGLKEAASLELWNDVLAGACDGEDASDAVLLELSRRLRHMPAAIRAAGEYVLALAPALTPRGLLERPAFFADFDKGDRERGFQSVIRQLAAALDADSRRLLALMAFLPEPVPEEACRTVLDEVPLAQTLARLAGSVMLASMERDVFGTHWYRLHAVVRQVLDTDASGLAAESGWVGYCIEEGSRAQRDKRFVLAGSLQDCARAFAEKLGLREDVATALVNKGNALANLKRLEEALACYDRAIEIREELVRAGRPDLSKGDLREDMASALMNKGVALGGLRRFDEELTCYDRAIEISEELVRAGRSDLAEDVATALMNRGVALGSLRRFDEELTCYDRAIEIREELVRAGRSDLRENVATALMNKGVALWSLERLEEALACYDGAIEIREELVRAGRSDLRENVATALENKHVLIEQQGDLTQALDLIGRAVAIRRQLHKEGYRHQASEFRRSLEWMAETLDSLGRAEEAAALRAEARDVK
ncbi:MAG TPA: tetratricopeptide repeat protein [Bryobacteraceae bacterium]